MIASIKMKGEQLELRLRQRTWGGARPGAGRKPGARPKVRHVARPSHRASHPVHVTVRARAGLPSFREEAIGSAVREAIAASGRSPILGRSFRVVQFSVQTNHVHLIVEAHDKESLSRGMRGLNTRLARAVNRVLGVHGRVWGERYHAHALRTPREVRNAIVYVLMNAKKHGVRLSGIDRFSSAQWFDGFAHRAPSSAEPPTVVARTWLGGVGWRTHGLIRVDERPR